MHKRLVSVIALVAALAVTPAFAQLTILPGGGEVNISGATLFAPFYPSKASTNDFNNVDNDFDSCSTPKAGFYYDCDLMDWDVDQLAADYSGGSSLTTFWAVAIRGVGSGNGLAEFRNFQVCGQLPWKAVSEGYWYNRHTGAPTGWSQTSVDSGIMDVPTFWFVQVPGTWDVQDAPAEEGYGTNPTVSYVTPNLAGGQSNKLKKLCTQDDPDSFPVGVTPCTGCLNITDPQDPNYVYDTVVAWVPVGIISNRGVGIENVKKSELQYLFTTGRMPNGLNIKAATRDSGSGTRNGAMNSICVDPSSGRGDNSGKKTSGTVTPKVGPTFQVSNMGGSSRMEDVVEWCGLAIGYSGVMGGSRTAADATAGKYELLGVVNDIGMNPCVAETPVRPTLAALVDNGDPCTGYQIGGPETMATLGDPNANRAAGDPKQTANNPMANQAAADYINNLIDSIDAFSGAPGGSTSDYFMPGEFLADTFLLPAGLEALPGSSPCEFETVTGRNMALRQYILDYNNMGFGGDTPPYGWTGARRRVPSRDAGTYSDGTGDGSYFYKDSGGTVHSVQGKKKLSERNALIGDFNNDAARDISDIAKMMEAVQAQLDFDTTNHGGAYGDMVGDYVVVVALGDFNSDGTFDDKDVRYFADGLALDGGVLDRKAGFTAVDNAWAALPGGDSNYFNVASPYSTGKAYAAGDARGDVTGSGYLAPGGDPLGADNEIDIEDVEYVKDNIADWGTLADAVAMDLSCDMDGDLDVDCDDVVEIVETILGTQMGDLDLDGDIDAADIGTLNANIGVIMAGANYADGDLDCDGDVDADDAAIQVPATTSIEGRYVYYNNSYHDGYNAAIQPIAGGTNHDDDLDAIDTNKAPLMVGDGQATFANWTGFMDGITGLMYEVKNPTATPVVGDFTFTNKGKNGTGSTAVTPDSFLVQTTADPSVVQVFVTFTGVANCWLEVTIGTGFGLAAPETHWWGNVRADSGSTTGTQIPVNATDELAARNNPSGFFKIGPTNVWDYNKDGSVNATDQLVARNNPSGFFSVEMISR